MKGKNAAKFFLVILVIAILTYLTLFGFSDLKISGAKGIRTGIDISGGVHATLYPPAGVNASDKELGTVKTIIGNRLNNQGIFDRNITIDKTKKCIVVEIPAKKGETANPQDALNDIGRTALLKFQEVVAGTTKDKSGKVVQTGQLVPTGPVILVGKDVKDAGVSTDPSRGIVVTLSLSSDGAKKFADATAKMAGTGRMLGIFMDDQLISSPTVDSAITGGEAIITGQKDATEAGQLADTIRSGSLPFKVEAKQIETISPSLGQGALDISIKAGYFAFMLVCLFMLAFYRLPGILAGIALLGHTVIQLLVISLFGITLTLPGIAGIILTIGMGVDANVIIFERIKEELRNGKTLRAAIDIGFKRAFTAIFDANLTTLISAGVLWYFGTGAIKGFAITLALGVALSFLTAVTVSRIMLKSVSDVNIAKHHWLYGA
jgi:preprotein translocase subunit SecD